MRLQRRAGAAVMATMLVTAPSLTMASVVVPMSLADLTAAATLIVDGTITDVRPVTGASGIERVVLVRTAAVWKGEPDETVYVRLPGGRVGRTETIVPGVPVVEPGDHVVWFLKAHPQGGHVVLGLHQGALRAQTTPDGQTLVMTPARTASSRGDVSRRPRPLADVASDVRALLAGGAQ